MSTRFPYSPARTPPIPAVIVTLLAPGGGLTVSPVSAHVDTAADRTVVPLALIQQLGVPSSGQATTVSFGGTTSLIPSYCVTVDIAGVGQADLNVLAHPNEPYMLLGRDFLQWFRITFDGPNQSVEFH